MNTVSIRGEGVAASGCAHLMSRAGLRLIMQDADRPNVPAIMLGETAQKLLADVFERGDLFEGLPRIRKRVVAWGANVEPTVMPHSAVVVSEQVLLDRIQRTLPHFDHLRGGEADWTVFASRPLPASSVEHHFGSRMASASAVTLRAGGDADACWIESLEKGWLFLLPGGGESGWLLSVGGPAESLLAESRVVAEQIAGTSHPGGTFPAHPRIADPLCAEGWLACGTAAIGFDPLCGDGTGHATREAILGSAVVRAVADGADVSAVVAHYQTRLLAAFKRHLEVCQEFYEGGRSGPWWDEELNSVRCGLEWCRGQLAGAPPFRYRLSGFKLEAI